VRAQARERLAAEWDEVAPHREELIASGRDLSYRYILLPSLTNLIGDGLKGGQRVLDAGCGTGTFLTHLAAAHPQVEFVGIDPSVTSVEIAKEHRDPLPNTEFRTLAVEELLADSSTGHLFDVVIANMLLQNVASFDDVVAACAKLLTPKGIFVFAVPHPCFWSRYWRYDKERWFRYDKELWIEAPYQTSLSRDSELTTTHVHRPMSAYINGLVRAGLDIGELCEPMPDAGLEGIYPVAWEFPRFLLGRCRLAAM
jgi:2-polyprenyl-3-methyl-5-hydroxy-6-metoxy-1,4-benzoquinol methylase